jgi:hypothetical protein
MSTRAPTEPGIGRWIAALALVAAIALVPSKACACLETYQVSPERVVLSVLLLVVLAVVALALPGTRVVWGVGAGLLAAISSAVALAVGSHSLALAASALFLPLLAMVLLAARHRLRAQRRANNAV